MKKYLLILIVAIFCLPNIANAQFTSFGIGPTTTGEREMRDQRRFNEKFFGESKAYQFAKKKKPRINRVHLLAIENTTDEATGLTTLSWADGSSYVGEIYRTVFHGMGTMIYPDKGKYHGQWKYDHRHGIGTMEYADGSKYVGKWVRDLPNGEGTFINPEGVAFTGKFKDGEPHGKCIIQDTDGQLYKARWYYGKLRKRSIKPLKEKNTK